MTVEFAQAIMHGMENEALNTRQLAKKTKIAESTINKFLEGNKNASISQASKIAKALPSLDREELGLIAVGYTPEEDYEKVLNGEKPGVIGIIITSKGKGFSRKPLK